MKDVTEVMKRAYAKGQKSQPKKQEEMEEASEEVKQTEPSVQAEEEVAVTVEAVEVKEDFPKKKHPKQVIKLARDDVSLDVYSVKRKQLGFSPFNHELWKWMKDFSGDNQDYGGIPINKSDLIEICMDIIMYDLKLKPVGYQSLKELRADIQAKMKKF